jgi:hypothetical protein
VFPVADALVERVLQGVVNGAVLQTHLIEFLLQTGVGLGHALQLHSKGVDLFL